SGLQTISLTEALPAITQSVSIDGSTQPGVTRAPLIMLDGTSAGSSVDGLDITADNCTIQWLAIENFSGDGVNIASANNLIANDVISGNQGNGITISGAAANANTVQASFIGTDPSGSSAVPNQGDGIAIRDGSHNLIGANTIGTSWTLGNVISGNAGDGV